MKQWLLPINILIAFLSMLAFWAVFMWSGNDPASWMIHARNLAGLIIPGFIVRFLIRRFIDPNAFFRREHRIITVLILFLLFDPTSPWWYFPIVRTVTELAQYFLRTTGGPLFNPAALGTVIVSFFGLLPSWWGTNPAPRFPLFGEELSLAAFFTLVCAGYVVYRYRKFAISLAALAAFALTYIILFNQSPLYIALEGTLLLFLLVMVPEPKTSPNMRNDQLIYGALVGTLVAFGLFFHFTESFLTALLLGNLYTHRKFLLGLLPLTSGSKQGTVTT